MTLHRASHHTELLQKLRANIRQEGTCFTRFMRLLAEFDSEKIWAKIGYANLFQFCTDELGLSRMEAASRCRILRLCKRLPQLLGMIEKDEISYTAIRVLAPILDSGSLEKIIKETRGMSTREIEKYRLRHEAEQGKEVNNSIRRIKSGVPREPVRLEGQSVGQPATQPAPRHAESPTVPLSVLANSQSVLVLPYLKNYGRN